MSVKFAQGIFCLFLSTGMFAQRHSVSAERIYEKANKVVVSIRTTKNDGQVITGSGVVFGKDIIVTNAHVISDAILIEVSKNGKIWKPQYYVVSKSSKDYALLLCENLNIEAPDWAALYDVGNKIYTIGDPLGLKSSMTDGIISQIRILDGISYVQISAPISPGNSGGGLFNDQGELIGITTFKLKDGENLNFALPMFEIAENQEDRIMKKIVGLGANVGARKYIKSSFEKIQSLMQECFLFDADFRFQPIFKGVSSIKLMNNGRIAEIIESSKIENTSKKWGLDPNGPDKIDSVVKYLVPISRIIMTTNHLEKDGKPLVYLVILQGMNEEECIKSDLGINFKSFPIALKTLKSQEMLTELFQELMIRANQE